MSPAQLIQAISKFLTNEEIAERLLRNYYKKYQQLKQEGDTEQLFVEFAVICTEVLAKTELQPQLQEGKIPFTVIYRFFSPRDSTENESRGWAGHSSLYNTALPNWRYFKETKTSPPPSKPSGLKRSKNKKS